MSALQNETTEIPELLLSRCFAAASSPSLTPVNHAVNVYDSMVKMVSIVGVSVSASSLQCHFEENRCSSPNLHIEYVPRLTDIAALRIVW